jgi:soluble lytic murein transglycosylase-like protein
LRPVFVRWAAYYGVSAALVEAVAWQESGWQQDVISSANAVGIGQIIPSTAEFISSELIGLPLSVNSLSDNVRMMTRFLSYLQAVEGTRCRTIAAYYEGPQNMAKLGVLPETVPYVVSVEALVPRFE